MPRASLVHSIITKVRFPRLTRSVRITDVYLQHEREVEEKEVSEAPSQAQKDAGSLQCVLPTPVLRMLLTPRARHRIIAILGL